MKRKGPMRLKGYLHLFDAHTSFKWQFPNFYRTFHVIEAVLIWLTVI